MKATVKIEKEVDIKKVIIDIKIRYVGDTDDDDVHTDFPMLSGEIWKATVLIDEGRIIDWPKGVARDLFLQGLRSSSEDQKGRLVMSVEFDTRIGVLSCDTEIAEILFIDGCWQAFTKESTPMTAEELRAIADKLEELEKRHEN